MPITRSTLLAGPASATFNGHTFFAHDGILVTPALELQAVDSDAQGVLDETVSGALVKIQFTPSAPFADLLALFPYTQANPGMSFFGSADTSLTLIASNGVRLTFSAVAVLQMPDLILTNRGPVTGAVTFLAMGARGLGLTTTNRLVTIDTTSVPMPPSGTPQLADDFVVIWGESPWIALRARDGIRVRFAMKTKPVLSDANALLDLTLERLEVEVRFVPATPSGPAEADLVAALQLQGANALPGRLLSASSNTLDVAGEHLFVRLPLAQLTRGEMAFDAIHSRVGELTFVAEQAFLETGAPEPLMVLAEGMP